jgi:hypothetical protein
MRVMGIEALVPRPGTSKAASGHKIYSYLMRGLSIIEPNHLWLIFNTAKYQGIDYKRQSALEKRLGTTFC